MNRKNIELVEDIIKFILFRDDGKVLA